MRALAASLAILCASVTVSCCVNPFIGTDTTEEPAGAGSPERETAGTLEEDQAAVQAHTSAAVGAGFDMRLVRVQPGVHLETEQLCDVGAALRLEAIEPPTPEEEAAGGSTHYDPAAVQRMSIKCVAPTGETWADLEFLATRASHVAEVVPGVRIRVRIRRADGGFFDYPIVDFIETVGPAPPTATVATG